MIEGASYTLSVQPDPKLDAYVDGLIAKIAAAQEPDGYLYTTRTIDPKNPHRWAGTERWVLENDDSHELYNLGHLFEAAVAHYQATGKRTLLDVAIKTADLLVSTFGPGKRVDLAGPPDHRDGAGEALSRHRRTSAISTSRSSCSTTRGSRRRARPAGRTYNQAHAEGRRADRAGRPRGARDLHVFGHGRRRRADRRSDATCDAIERIWDNVVSSKLYITGGIGATGSGEAFGDDYELPNMTAYNETCASVGMDYWNHRLFLLHGDAKYIDVMERTLYNGLISGVSLDGKTFFYPNPLESNGQHERSPWFGVACCPGNITRFMPSVPGYVYAQQRRLGST